MECPVMFMGEPTTRISLVPPFVHTKIINIIMILSPKGNRLELLTPHLILLMVLNTPPTAFPFSPRRLIQFLMEVRRLPQAMPLLLGKRRLRGYLLSARLLTPRQFHHFRF